MTPSPQPRLAVAQLRRVWFNPTETFLHNTVTSFRRTRPLLIGYVHENRRAFPVDAPVLALYPRGSLRMRWNRWRSRRWGGDYYARFHGLRTRLLLHREGARLLHAHFGYTGVHALPLQRSTELPLVTTFYGQDLSQRGRRPEWRARYRELFARGERFLVEGPFMRERLVELGCPFEKTAVQPIGIPLGRYPFRPRRPRSAGEPVRILCCASFREKKGLVYAVRAVALARQRQPDLELRIGGEGPERARLEAEIRWLGLSDCTSLLGFLSHEQMIREMDAADLFLQPSVTAGDGDTEGGAPTTLLEAQACGLPVLASLHADIPFVVDPGKSALLAPERDVEGLAAHLRTLLEEPERWAEMGAAGRAQVERAHDIEQTTARLEDLYLELAGGPG